MASRKKTSLVSTLSSSRQSVNQAPFFYESGGRSDVLNQIHHCIQSSSGVIAITGPTGSGRSAIIQSLMQSFKNDDVELCLLSEDCEVLETEEELYCALAAGFGLEQKSIEVFEDLVERVQYFIRTGLRNKQKMIIVVDDIKQHTDDILETLLQLVGSMKGLTLLLSGEPSLADVLKKFHTQSFLIHQIVLRPFLAEEAYDFLRQYVSHCNVFDELILDQKEIDEVMSKTGGNPSLLMREAQQYVYGLQTQSKSLRGKFPVVHMIAFVSVIVFTIGVFFYYPDSSTSSPVVGLPPVTSQGPVNNVQETAPKIALPEIGDLAAKNDNVYAEPIINNGVSGYTLMEKDLLERPTGNIVLQVSNLSSEKLAKAFIEQAEVTDKNTLTYYRRRSGAESSYIVLYGDYPDKQTAIDVEQSLPESLKKSAPWPRSIADIQRELKSRREDNSVK